MHTKKSLFVSAALLGAITAFCFTAPAFAGASDMTRGLAPKQRSLYTIIASLEGKRDNSIHLKLSADGRTRHFGDAVRLHLESSKDAYVVLIDQDAKGRTHFLVPNRWHRHALYLKANSTVTIPNDKARWSVVVGGPRGADMVYAIASNRRMSRREERHLLLEYRAGHAFPEERHPTRAAFRGLFIRRGKVRRGTASLRLNIVP